MAEQYDGLDSVWGEFFDEAVKKSDSEALIQEIEGLNAEILALLYERKRLMAEFDECNLGGKYGFTPKMSRIKAAIDENARMYQELSDTRHALAQQWAALGHIFPGIPPLLLTSGSDTR